MASARVRPPSICAERLGVFHPDGQGGRAVALDLDAIAIAPGARVCVTGPSGSGKSTLLNVLSGIMRPDRGVVTWDGVDIGRWRGARRDRARRETIGFVFQGFHLIPELTPLENVLIPATFGRFRIPAALIDRARGLLDRFETPASRARAADLSRGEQQRVALARALLLDPPVIFADEPTANLDGHAAELVIAALVSLNEEGRSLLAVSHDPALIERVGSAVTLEHGRLAEGRYDPGARALSAAAAAAAAAPAPEGRERRA